MTPRARANGLVATLLMMTVSHAVNAAELRVLSASPSQWARAELVLRDVVQEGANPFDPDQIAVTADVAGPDGRTVRVPMFWYVAYSSALVVDADGKTKESVTVDPAETGEWRLRWTPTLPGRHTINVHVTRRGGRDESVSTLTVNVAPPAANAHGFIRVEPHGRRFFRTDDGRPLPFFGLNACWPGPRGTFDYADWLPAMGRNGINYTRLWMGNAGFRAELYADERLHYNQATLWQLDRVLDTAAANGVNVLLCMGYHGEFQTELDGWGTTGWWATHAYRRANGGPCERPNDFFTDPAAAKLYEKRLRYLVARYGATPNLVAWQFFNEIDNIYGDPNATSQQLRDGNRLVPADVVAWHDRMGRYLKSIDPYGHLVTTSFGSTGNDPHMWSLPALDYVNWHWYSTWGGPYTSVTEMAAGVGTTIPSAYGKPTVIAEFGTDGRGWGAAQDAERRGLRQALWAGVFAGTAGTSVPWWWEDIHAENLYPLWKSLRDFLPADFGIAAWKPLAAVRPAAPAAVLGTPGKDAPRFSQRLDLTTRWAKSDGLPIVISRPGDDGEGRITGYVHGTSKPELRTPFVIHVNAGNDAKLVVRVNSVAADSTLIIKQNGRPLAELALPNKDGKTERNNEYGLTLTTPLQAGRAEIDISNAGTDWVFLDHVTINGAVAADEAPVAAAAVPLEHYLLGDAHTRLLWVVDSRYAWPRNRTRPATPLDNARLTLTDWPDGTWDVQWWDPRGGKAIRTDRVTASGGTVDLTLPRFAGDVAARLTPVSLRP